MNPIERIEHLATRVDTLSDLLAAIADEFGEANQEVKAEISRAYVINHSAEWSVIAAELVEFSNWPAVDTGVEKFADFLERLRQTAAQPRLTRLATQIEKCVYRWGIAAQLDWLAFLEDADDVQVEKLERISNSKESRVIDDTATRKIWKEWGAYQREMLLSLQRTPGNLLEWLDRVETSLKSTESLDRFLTQRTADANGDSLEPIIKSIHLKWLHAIRARIQNTNAQQHKLEWSDLNFEIEWIQLQASLHALGSVLGPLSTPEQRAVQNEVNNWEKVDATAVQALAGKLAELAKMKETFHKGQESTGETPKVGRKTLPIIKALVGNRPELSKAKVTSIDGYLQTYNDWMRKWEDWKAHLVRTQVVLLQQVDNTRLLARRINSEGREPILIELSEVAANIESAKLLAQIVVSYDRVQDLHKLVQKLLRQSLGRAESELLEELLSQQGDSVNRIAVTENQTEADKLAVLGSLASRGIIRLEVVFVEETDDAD